MSESSHVARLLKAIEKLPAEGRDLMTALYRKGMTDEQACAHCNISLQDLQVKRSQALRALMTAVH